MAAVGLGSQRRGYETPPDSPSTTNLLIPSSPGGASSLRSYGTDAALASRFASGRDSMPASISDKFSLSPDPTAWGADLSLNFREADDDLHAPDPRRDHRVDKGGHIFTARGLANLGCLFILGAGILTLFAGYPLISYFNKKLQSTQGGFNLGGVNASGQVPSMGNFGLIDLDTDPQYYTRTDYVNGDTWQLVFSDEFNVENRTFWPGDDPYWEAVDLHYWQTNNLEWLEPSAITTKNGSLQITLSEQPKNNLNWTSGMMSTWNKFCFTGGIVEVSVILPGINNVVGLWPAIWTMGNLGRAGFGASLEGMWPYTYDSCDVGTVANQSRNGLPVAATEDGANGGVLSYLPGQRLSRCSCPGSSHPGPMHSDGTFVGRAAPEIDIFEAQVTGNPLSGQVSQSSQWAPFNHLYQWDNTSSTYYIANTTSTFINPYQGGVDQQAASGVTQNDQTAYELSGMNWSTYGIQYAPGFESAYIAWIAQDRLAWQLDASAMVADPIVEISARPVPQEPMYIIMNLGMSENFGYVDLAHLQFPAILYVDYVRVYQDPNNINIGCDPADFPTAAYISEYLEAYTNPNLTTWAGPPYNQPVPQNSFLDQC